jgi:uncharacterized membrane protein
MQIGPVEYLLISFPGNKFKGEIAPAIANLVENDTIHILDLTFIIKDADGTTAMFEYDELPEAAGFVDIDGEADGLFSDEDLEIAAAALEPNSSALFIVWEDVWATELADAIRGAGGQIVAGERIPRDIVEAAFAGAEEATS